MSTNQSAADILKRIGELSPEKQKLLRKLLEKENSNLLKRTIVPQKRDGSPFPLSFSQRRLWLLHQANPFDPSLNEAAAFRVRGAVDPVVGEKSLDEVARRNEILRTTFAVVDGEPVQIVSPSLKLPLLQVDLSLLPEREREAEARRIVIEQARKPFDLSRGPLLRVALLRLGERDHVLLLVAHHIICDGWSIEILVREMLLTYQAYRLGLSSPLPSLPIQYADYAVWQREWLVGEVLERLSSYWRARLEGISPLWASPERPPVSNACMYDSVHSFEVAPQVYELLKEFCKQKGVTLFMALLSAFNVLLYRLSGSDDIVVGTPSSGRVRPELENIAGCFSNVMLLRTDLSSDPTFCELLGRVKDVCLGAYAHQEMPFQMLVEAFCPGRDILKSFPMQVFFGMHDDVIEAVSGITYDGLSFTPLDFQFGVSKLDLFFYVWEGRGKLRVTVDYNPNLFDPGMISLLESDFKSVLERGMAEPERKVSELALSCRLPKINSVRS